MHIADSGYYASGSCADQEETWRFDIYCRPPEFTVIQSGKLLAGGLQSGLTVNLIGVQYKYWTGWESRVRRQKEDGKM